jgi:uncharacterized membrane protein
MNTAHVHLLLNHVPTVGTVIAFGVFLLSFIRKDAGMRRLSLELFFVVALVTLPAYISGVGTQLALEQQRPEVVVELMKRHHDAAVLGSIGMVITGLLAWLALWQMRRLSRPSTGVTAGVLLFAVITIAFMARAANLGGEIRHPEIVLVEQALDEIDMTSIGPEWLTADAIAGFTSGQTWVWPTAEALHFIGLWILFGPLVIINLRLLGVIRGVSFASVHRLMPWAMLGLTINIITGMMFLIAAPGQYVENVAFFWKIGLLILAGANLLYLTAFEGPWEVEAGSDAPLRLKAAAASSLVLWIGVMYFGRMLPFIGNAF